MMVFAPGCVLWPSFCSSFPWSQLCRIRISENARRGSPWQIWHSSASRALWKPRFQAKGCARLALQGNALEDMMAFAPGFFLWPSFCRSFPWSQLGRISENARWGSPWQFDIARLHGLFGSRGLQQSLVLGWNLKEILMRTWWHSR